MAIGTPIVTTNVGGTPDIIEHNKEGILVTPRVTGELVSAIMLLLEDSTLRSKLVSSAELKIKQFSIEAMIDKILEVLKKTA